MLKYLFLLVLFYNTAFANPIITKVVDGDTIDVEIENVPVRIRFKCSDTPECGKSCGKKGKSQYIGNIDIGKKSHDFIINWLKKHQYNISLKCDNKLGKYNRPSCYILANNENLNHLLIKEGYAVASDNTKYCNTDEMKMSEVAKQEKRGLWALGWDTMPSNFRYKK